MGFKPLPVKGDGTTAEYRKPKDQFEPETLGCSA